uniref:Uncharacterized protein n=1 Tax=Photinus pyralis TaxID=7054 RepID=A0A1Y1KBS7_PHOPY
MTTKERHNSHNPSNIAAETMQLQLLVKVAPRAGNNKYRLPSAPQTPSLNYGDTPARHISMANTRIDVLSFVYCLLDSNRLGQVAREINIETLKNSQPVSNQLQGNDVEKTLKAINSLRDLDLLSFRVLKLGIVRVAKDDGFAFTCNDLLVGIERLLENLITSEDHDDGHIGIDQGQHTVL